MIEDERTAHVEAGGATRKVIYTISDIGESYKKPANYAYLGRHWFNDPGLNDWWPVRNTNYNDTVIHNSYPYVISTDRTNLYYSLPGAIWQTRWVTCSFYRLTLDAQNISGLATGAGKDPWILPIMGNKALDGGTVNMSLYFTYLTDKEFADIKAGSVVLSVSIALLRLTT